MNGSVVHFTSVFAKPSFSAIPYTTARSKPLPFVGSSSSKYGGKAGLSVATVSVPGVRVFSLSFVHWLTGAAAAPDEPGGEDELEELALELPPQAASVSTARGVRMAAASGRAARMVCQP